MTPKSEVEKAKEVLSDMLISLLKTGFYSTERRQVVKTALAALKFTEWTLDPQNYMLVSKMGALAKFREFMEV